MRKLLVILTSACVTVLITGVAYSSVGNIKHSITHPTAHVYNENPSPSLVGNNQMEKSQFLAREKAIEIAHIPQDAHLTSAVLETWGIHMHEDNKDEDVITEVAPDRMVWVVKADFPNGTSTKGGFYANAKKIITIDAETGRVLNVDTSGKLVQSYMHFNGASK